MADVLKDFSCPKNISEVSEAVNKFIGQWKSSNKRIVLVTSGGTTVPLESRTVRFIDNFSVGTRGATSAEYFLDAGYAVLFLHRRGSLQPYKRHFANRNLFDMLVSQSGQICVKEEHINEVSIHLTKNQKYSSAGLLLSVEFTSLADYLHYLKVITVSLSTCERTAMLYLAAAVSDFYIPANEMPEHKIQSNDGPLNISLQLVPKLLQPLVMDWTPNAFVVSFKLETNPDILLSKAHGALEKYKHQVVIGNILETRKTEVIVVTTHTEDRIQLSEDDVKSGLEIEKMIIAHLAEKHGYFITS